MTDAPATAVDKSKETTPPAHKEAADKAAEKLKADATDKKVDPAKADSKSDGIKADGTKANDSKTEAKKDGSDKTDATKPEEKSWTERALEEVRNSSAAAWLGIKPADVTRLPVKADAKKDEASFFEIPPFDYPNGNQPLAQKAEVKVETDAKLDIKPGAKPEEKTGFSWLYDKVSSGIDYAAKTVADTASYGWDAMTSSFDSVSTSLDKLGKIETTRKGADSEYKITTDEGKLVNISAYSKDLKTEINNDEKKVIVKQGDNTFKVNHEGDILASNPKFEVAAEAKNGHRILTDKSNGRKYDFDPKTGDMIATDADGNGKKISKEQVETDYKGVTNVINSMVAQGDAIAKKMQDGTMATDGHNGVLLRGNTLIKTDKATETISMVTLDADKNPTGLTRIIDTKNGIVTTDDHGKKSQESLDQFLKENPKSFGWLHHRGHCIDVDATHKDNETGERRLKVAINARNDGEPSMVATDIGSGKKVSVDVDPHGKVKQVETDAQGKQIGNTVLVNPEDKKHAYQEINQKGIVTTDVDFSHNKPEYHINDDQGNNLMTTNQSGDVSYGSGDNAFSVTSDGSLYGANGELYHDGRPDASDVAEAAAVQAQSDAYVAVAAASTAASIVASAMGSPGSMDAGYLAGILGSAYNAASAAMGQSMASNSAGGILAANSAMAMIESKFGEIGRVSGERSNFETAGLSPDEVNAALKLSMSGNYTSGQAQDMFKQDNPAA